MVEVWPAWWEARELVMEKDEEKGRQPRGGLKRMKKAKRKLAS